MRLSITTAIVLVMCVAAARAGIGQEATQKLYERVTPSLVAIKFTYDGELRRAEKIAPGIVVRDDGLVMCPIGFFDMRIPDEQLKNFQIIVPDPAGGDPTELDAKLLGRDERYNVAFFQPSEPSKDGRKWTPLKFEEVPVKVGDPVVSIGMLPKSAGYKTYVTESAVAATLRGEQPQVLVQGGGLAGVGAPVFTPEGKPIGIVLQMGPTPYLDDGEAAVAAMINAPPRIYLPARDFLPAIADPPKEGTPVAMPWLGVVQMTGLNKDVAEIKGLKGQPAVQIGDVIPDGPSAKAGLKRGDIIVKLNGQPLERGDEPEELPDILRRQISRIKVGEAIKLGVLRGNAGDALQDIEVTTTEMPKRANLAKRWFAEDLGFSAREMVFMDTYVKRLKPDANGVIVAMIRPQSSAQSGGLHFNDVITELNRAPVKDLESFRKDYEEFRKSKPKEAVVMVVLREGNTQTIRIEPPQ